MSEKIENLLLSFIEKIVDNIEVFIICMIILGCAVFFGLAIYTESIAPTKGVVVDKSYTKEHTYTTYKTVKQGKETIQVPVQKYVGAEYKITIEGLNKNEEMMRYSFEVAPEEYESIQLGDTYIRKLE